MPRKGIPISNDNLTQREVDYTQLQIRKITPYLDKVQQPCQSGGKKPLTNRHRAFAWYYVFNGNIKADAYKRCKYGRYNKEKGEFELKVPEKRRENKNFNINCAVMADNLFKKQYIKECIHLIQENHKANLLQDFHQTYIEQLQIEATYDPSMFIDPTGKPVFKKWEEIPEKYRCCIKEIETKAYGKDADRVITKIVLVDRSKARQELVKYAPHLIPCPDQYEIIHKTIDKQGELVGFNGNFNPQNLSDKELKDLADKIQDAY